MTPPVRIQRKRTKGWRMPEGAVYVGRPTRWGNPYGVGDDHTYYGGPGFERATASQCVALYREHILAVIAAEGAEVIRPLRGKNLACFCPLDRPCHADVLLELAGITGAM